MGFSQIVDPDEAEALEPRGDERPLDPISAALDSGAFVRSHRFAGLFIRTAVGRSPRLSVSRYYWDAEPPVAVDFRKEIRFGDEEMAAKRAYFEATGIRYVVVVDEWDEEGVSLRLTPSSDDSEAVATPDPGRLLTAPRRRSANG